MAGLDDCARSTDWNPITASQSTSTFAGLFAGFVFASIVVILANRDKIEDRRGDGDAARALKLLLAAFFGLAIVSYLDGVVRGEQVCHRAQTEYVINGGALAVGALVVLVALSWVVLAFDRHHNGILGFFRKVFVFASLFVTLMLVVSSVGYVGATLDGRHTWSDALMFAAGGVAMAAILVISSGRRIHARKADGTQVDELVTSRWDRRVSLTAWAGLSFCGISAAASSAAAADPTSRWKHMSPTLAYSAGWLALAAPLCVIIFCVLALARVPDPDADPQTGSVPAAGNAPARN